ncbi:hypothetical protein [Streptomyces sp. NPDC046925]|uniref:hypothetical protein n=1 Tax=Streptomyces sp. NPDC046925 TaxID=3155375 RepID=UPI0033E2AE80
MTDWFPLFPIELERADLGRTAVTAFSECRSKLEPFSVEGWFAYAHAAVDAYTKAAAVDAFDDAMAHDVADAIDLLRDVAIDLFHFLDGQVKWSTFHRSVLGIVSECVAWDAKVNFLEGAPEFPDTVALCAALSLRAQCLNPEEIDSRFLINSASEHFQEEAEAARWKRVRYTRRTRYCG